MSERTNPADLPPPEHMAPGDMLVALVYELYNPVSLLGSHLNRLADDDTPLSEDEYEALFVQMQEAVRQLSKTVVYLKRYAQEHYPDAEPPGKLS